MARERSVRLLPELDLVAVARDVDEGRLELHERPDGLQEFMLGDAFQRRHDLERSEGLLLRGYYILYLHGLVCPLPSINHLYEVISSSPIGPRAPSF